MNRYFYGSHRVAPVTQESKILSVLENVVFKDEKWLILSL